MENKNWKMATSRLKNRVLYRPFDIWRRIDSTRILRYRCFEILPEKKFCVQSADFFSSPVNESQKRSLEKQAFELFLECSPEDRSELFDTIEGAIEAHDRDFNELDDG
jgi:hypothetical protein